MKILSTGEYLKVSKGLIYKSVRNLFPFRITSTSKLELLNPTPTTLSKEYSAVNSIAGWQLLSIFKNSLMSLPPVTKYILIENVVLIKAVT